MLDHRPGIAEGMDALHRPTRTHGRENIKVLVRIRPLLELETGPAAVMLGQESNVIRVNGKMPNKQLQCSYDAVIGPDECQDGLSSHVRECTSAVLEGENSTIFAYGQTGSGKTYTMFGAEVEANEAAALGHSKGVIPLAVADLFKGLAVKGESGEDESSVWVSLVQLYNEQLFDMLRDPQRTHPLAIHEQPDAGMYVQGLSEYAVHTAGECLELLRVGREHRTIRETHMNHASSRSHSIFQIVVEQKRRSELDGERILRSKFNLVDLAGSEKWDVKQEMEEVRVSEMTNINVSLYTLGRVIAALSTPISNGQGEKGRQPHIPYRDSKLTRLLQDSLGGNTRTRIIATLSPASESIDETISTLRFADRAKQVMAFVRVNEHRPVDHALVQRLQAEIKHLKNLLSKAIVEPAPAEDDPAEKTPQSVALAATAEAQLLGYQQTNEQLRRENTALRENSIPADAVRGSVAVAEDKLGADVVTLRATNTALGEAIGYIVGNVRRFFRFEIEEEDLRTDLTKVITHLNANLPAGVSWCGDALNASMAPLGFANAALGINRRKTPDERDYFRNQEGAEDIVETNQSGSRATSLTSAKNPSQQPRGEQFQEELPEGNRLSLPPVPGVKGNREPKSEKLAYRLRGKHADEVVVVMKKEVSEEEEERRLRRELKLAKERMKKNLVLQEWLLQKEQREIEALANESARRHEMERDRRRRDEEFRKRAAKQKAKVKKFYETAQTDAKMEAEHRDHEFLHGQRQGEAQAAGDSSSSEKDPG